MTTRDQLRPEPDDGFAYPVPFSILGRGVREVIVEFGSDDHFDWSPPAGVGQRLRLQGQIHPDSEWTDLLAFEWFPPPEGSRSMYIAHRNIESGG
jgi:hypothetical protein